MGITRHPLFLAQGHLEHLRTDDATARTLQQSFRDLTLQSSALADTFYARLFERQPALRAMFPADLAAQKQKLVESLGMVVSHLHDPQLIGSALARLGEGHERRGVRPEHYPIVCAVLLQAMVEVGGPSFTTAVRHEWLVALERVSGAMVREAASQSRAQ